MADPVLSSFALVAVSEMGDKTQLLAFSLAARFRRPWPILAGILIATLANHSLASLLGSWVATNVGPKTLGYALGALFIAFGFWTLVPDRLEESDSRNAANPFVATVVLFFLAEMGDKTQFATMALAARFGDAFRVTLGTTLGMMLADGLAVLLGDRIAHRVRMRSVRIFAAILFFVFGAWSLYGAWRA